MSDKGSGSQPGYLTRNMTRRDLLKGAAAVVVGATFGPMIAGCGGSETTTTTAGGVGAVKMGGHLRVAAGAGSAKEDLNIHGPALTPPSMAMRFNMYDSLLEFDHAGVLGVALAEMLDPNADGTQFTVRLKSDLVFHDGSAVNADAVVYSFNRILDPDNPGLAAKQLRGLTPNGIVKVDDLTVRFELEVANAIFPEALSAYSAGIVPVGYDPKAGDGAIGTGPFMLAKPGDFQPGIQAVLVKNPNYWRRDGGPYVDQLSIIEFADTTAQLNALLGGAADYCQMIAGAQREIATGAGFSLLEAKTGSWIPFTMNCMAKPFDDVRVRQAFRLIVDRPEMIAQAADGLQWVGNDMYAPFDAGYPADLPQREQDLEKAKSLLKEAGQEDLTIKLTTSTSVSSGAPAAATVFAQQAKGAGVTVQVDEVTGDVFWGDEYLKYPFAMDNWGTRGYLAQAGFGSLPGAIYNETHYGEISPKYVSLVEEAFGTVDDAKRNELIKEAATLEHEEGGYIVYGFDMQVDAHAANVQGAMPDFSGLASAAGGSRYRLVSLA
ncbi:MAG: ABC transporter substrate-binding protein [Actinobacteria bacterium]|nr:ABC transporter substrate-binding protein [Actinomycetota bacterium]